MIINIIYPYIHDNSMKAQDCMVLSAMSGSFHFWCSNQPYQMSGPSREQLDPR